jgi:DNA-binding HxlR family transcriptional regulator
VPRDSYGQYCPVAKAAELIDQRWTLLVIRELVAGSTRFNDIHRGVPRMSRTLLSKRLRQLVADRFVERRERPDGPVYELTPAGQEFLKVIEALGEWGVRWIDSLTEEELDPAFLLWDMHRSIDTDALPDGRTVLAITFRDLQGELRDWWLVLTPTEVDVCEHDPGFGIDVTLDTELRTFVRVWRGDIPWDDAVKAGRLQVRGLPALRRQVPGWFHLSYFSSVPRVARPGGGSDTTPARTRRRDPSGDAAEQRRTRGADPSP